MYLYVCCVHALKQDACKSIIISWFLKMKLAQKALEKQIRLIKLHYYKLKWGEKETQHFKNNLIFD